MNNKDLWFLIEQKDKEIRKGFNKMKKAIDDVGEHLESLRRYLR